MLTFLKPTSKVEQEPDNTGSRSRAEIVLKHRNNDIIVSLEIPHCRIYMIVTNIVTGFSTTVYRIICCHVEHWSNSQIHVFRGVRYLNSYSYLKVTIWSLRQLLQLILGWISLTTEMENSVHQRRFSCMTVPHGLVEWGSGCRISSPQSQQWHSICNKMKNKLMCSCCYIYVLKLILKENQGNFNWLSYDFI